MTRNQRLGFLGIAALIAVVAVVLLAGSGDDSSDSGEQAAQTATPTATADDGGEATPEATETATPTPTPRPKPPLLQSGSVKKLDVEQGDTVRFRVRSDRDDEVHVHGYDRMVDVSAGETVSVSFKATITGIFE